MELGPILSFRGASAGGESWIVSVLHVGPAPVDWQFDSDVQLGPPEELWSVGERRVWRRIVTVPLAKTGRTVSFTGGGRVGSISVPGQGFPPRMAYASCNGFSSARDMKGVKDKNALWKRMAGQHGKEPYHLLLMGGDQVYADEMWEVVPEMKAWAALDWDEQNAASAPAAMVDAVRAFYMDLYVNRWSQPEVANMLASVPTIMMWDDHDLIDGWGSYPEDRQKCEVFQTAIGPAATEAFRAFQQQLEIGEVAPNGLATKGSRTFTLGHRIGSVAIVALDMRSQRRLDQVLPLEHWTSIFEWMEKQEGLDHLILMSSIPVIYPGFDLLEKILGWWPGQNELEDDLADHWRTRKHKGERLRLIHRLLTLCETDKVRPTIISGDVHVAAIGYVESDRGGAGRGTVVNQLISSGIVHPGPPGAVVFALRHLFDSADEIDRGIVGRMVDFPGTQVRFIGKRNFLSLEPDKEMQQCFRFWANWHVEGEDQPYTKVIHPLASKKVEPPIPAPPPKA